MIDIRDHAALGSVMSFFSEIAAIPHSSSNTDKIASYLCDFAERRGLWYTRDDADNVIIRKPATEGYENRQTVILQGHTDMVPAVAAGVSHNFDTDGLRLYRDGDYLKAVGTTLGADDGIAVAYALALLDSTDIPHPMIEAVFTSDEEIGLLGATALDTSHLTGKLMINLDSGAEGIFTVGCAGGVRADITLPILREEYKEKGYRLKLYGLAGGHSGIEIDKGRENAIKLMAELLSDIGKFRLVSLIGGNADNAIPRECTAEFISEVLTADIEAVCESFIARYRSVEADIAYEIMSGCSSDMPMSAESTKAVIALITDEPTGVIAMSEDIKGLVETSLNMGIIESDHEELRLSISIRSSKNAAKYELLRRVTDKAASLGAVTESHGDYPGWEYKKDSYLRDLMCKVYKDEYGKDAKVIAIHAGLECGIFSGKIEGLDCVSTGPDHFDIHTPMEHLSLSSTERVWEFLKKVLENI